MTRHIIIDAENLGYETSPMLNGALANRTIVDAFIAYLIDEVGRCQTIGTTSNAPAGGVTLSVSQCDHVVATHNACSKQQPNWGHTNACACPAFGARSISADVSVPVPPNSCVIIVGNPGFRVHKKDAILELIGRIKDVARQLNSSLRVVPLATQPGADHADLAAAGLLQQLLDGGHEVVLVSNDFNHRECSIGKYSGENATKRSLTSNRICGSTAGDATWVYWNERRGPFQGREIYDKEWKHICKRVGLNLSAVARFPAAIALNLSPSAGSNPGLGGMSAETAGTELRELFNCVKFPGDARQKIAEQSSDPFNVLLSERRRVARPHESPAERAEWLKGIWEAAKARGAARAVNPQPQSGPHRPRV